MAYLTKFFGALMNHIIREYAGRKIKFFLNVSPLKIMDILLSLFKVSSLYYTQVVDYLLIPVLCIYAAAITAAAAELPTWYSRDTMLSIF